MRTVFLPTSRKFPQYCEFNDYFFSKKEVIDSYGWIEDLFIKEMPFTEYLLANVPEEFHGVLNRLAWEQGHHAGEDEVENILRNLVETMLPAIEKFKKRLESEQ